MNLTFKLSAHALPCKHVDVEVYHQGVLKGSLLVTRDDFDTDREDVTDDCIKRILISHIKESGLTTPAAIKADVEGRIFKI